MKMAFHTLPLTAFLTWIVHILPNNFIFHSLYPDMDSIDTDWIQIIIPEKNVLSQIQDPFNSALYSHASQQYANKKTTTTHASRISGNTVVHHDF